MAYFSNGTEGMLYTEKYCNRCVHGTGKYGNLDCAVWDVHLLFSYEECNSGSNAKTILDTLIPMDIKNRPSKCSMFKHYNG